MKTTTTTTTLRTTLPALLTILFSLPVFAADYEATMKVNLQKIDEAKTMAETAGAKVLSGVGKEAAADAKSKLETAGGVVELL